ncbi:phage integrase central domain-containing protein [Hydrogenophaga sp.]|uniref:phage integrase central domain-containing protein n=1 Tax=Hydrogenophaga sp. TaxID=1904254 RepID=UPI003F6CB97A
MQRAPIQWWESWKSARSDSHTVYVWRRLEADVFPAIGFCPVAEIEAPELVAMMKSIKKRGALDIAKRALQTCSQIFRYAIAHGLAKRKPRRRDSAERCVGLAQEGELRKVGRQGAARAVAQDRGLQRQHRHPCGHQVHGHDLCANQRADRRALGRV